MKLNNMSGEITETNDMVNQEDTASLNDSNAATQNNNNIQETDLERAFRILAEQEQRHATNIGVFLSQANASEEKFNLLLERFAEQSHELEIEKVKNNNSGSNGTNMKEEKVDTPKSATTQRSQDVRVTDRESGSFTEFPTETPLDRNSKQFYGSMFKTGNDKKHSQSGARGEDGDNSTESEGDESNSTKKELFTNDNGKRKSSLHLGIHSEKQGADPQGVGQKNFVPTTDYQRRLSQAPGKVNNFWDMCEDGKVDDFTNRMEANFQEYFLGKNAKPTHDVMAYVNSLKLKSETEAVDVALKKVFLTGGAGQAQYLAWLEAITKYAHRSADHKRQAETNWRKTVSSSLYKTFYNFNFKFAINAINTSAIDDGRVFYRFRGNDSAEERALPRGYRMEFNGELQDLRLNPFIRLVTLMATPTSAQMFYETLISVMSLRYGKAGPLSKLEKTDKDNVKEHYDLTEDYLNYLMKYNEMLSDLVSVAMDEYPDDRDFLTGIDFFYSEKSSQRKALAWFIETNGSPYLNDWWKKRALELQRVKTIKQVKRDSKFSIV